MDFYGPFDRVEWAKLCQAPFWILESVGAAGGEFHPVLVSALRDEVASSPARKVPSGRAWLETIDSNFRALFELAVGDRAKDIPGGLRELDTLLERLPPDESDLIRSALVDFGRAVAAAPRPGADVESMDRLLPLLQGLLTSPRAVLGMGIGEFQKRAHPSTSSDGGSPFEAPADTPERLRIALVRHARQMAAGMLRYHDEAQVIEDLSSSLGLSSGRVTIRPEALEAARRAMHLARRTPEDAATLVEATIPEVLEALERQNPDWFKQLVDQAAMTTAEAVASSASDFFVASTFAFLRPYFEGTSDQTG